MKPLGTEMALSASYFRPAKAPSLQPFPYDSSLENAFGHDAYPKAWAGRDIDGSVGIKVDGRLGDVLVEAIACLGQMLLIFSRPFASSS
jgi:hypothetical protein